MASKSLLLHGLQLGQRLSPAARTSRRRSSPGWRGCGPRQRTCAPCGRGRCPRRRSAAAWVASLGVSALVRTSSVRNRSAQAMMRPNSPEMDAAAVRMLLTVDVAGGAVQGDPVALLKRSCRPAQTAFLPRRMWISPQPETQQVPMPRATTAAWEVMPPRTVRMPCAIRACPRCPRERSPAAPGRPCSPLLAQSTASSAVKTTLPQAAPGEAGQAGGRWAWPASGPPGQTAGAAGRPGCLGSIISRRPPPR